MENKIDKEDIPKGTIERFLFYKKCLVIFKDTGRKQCSSSEIAKRLKLKPTLVRKDLSYIGPLGRRGIGYSIEKVLERINQVVYPKKERPIALIGVGNIGKLLLDYPRFKTHSFNIKVAFDKNRDLIGKTIDGVKIESLKKLKKRVAKEGIRLGIIAVPPAELKEVIEIVKDSDIEAILNFTPCCLVPYENIAGDLKIKNIDIAVEMDRLLYYTLEEE